MSGLTLLKLYALAGVPLGLLLGLGLGLIAHRDDGWGGYDSLRRRAARLGHVAAVMLPLIAGFYALALGAWSHQLAAAELAARLWVAGGCGMVAGLALATWRPRLRLMLPLPALALTASALIFAHAFLSPTGGDPWFARP